MDWRDTKSHIGAINSLHWIVICQLWQQYSVTANRYLKPLSMCQKSPARVGCSQLSKTSQETQLRSGNSRDLFAQGKVWPKLQEAACCNWRGSHGAELEGFCLIEGEGSPCMGLAHSRVQPFSSGEIYNLPSRRHLSSYYKLSLVKGRSHLLHPWFTSWRFPRKVRVMLWGPLCADWRGAWGREM